jgi:dephospho-CoA kinase
MTLAIGITGGIGSGKSTVCELFKILGIPVFEADLAAKKLINTNSEIKNGLIQLFGSDIYTKDKTINRKMLANFIFNDNLLIGKVNELIHPVVRTEYLNWLKQQKTVYIVHEAAILFESGFYSMMDYTILVTAPEETRIERVIKRDNVLPETVKRRMEKQWLDEDKRKLASIEFVNDNKNLLIPKILEIDTKLKKHGKIW